MLGVFEPIENVISKFIVSVNSVLAHVGGDHQGWTWALSIVLLVACIRVVLFPLFAKQSRSMRKMQTIQPQMKELQRRYADDKQTLNQEMMKLYRESGTNPIGGCLPLIVQAPIFISLYRVLTHVTPPFTKVQGMSVAHAQDLGLSTIAGTPISAKFTSQETFLSSLDTKAHELYGGSVSGPTAVKIVCAVFILAMSIATFVTTRQSMARSAAMQAQTGTDNPLLRQQKLIMYVMPLFLAVFGVNVPLGALIYWLSNNVFTMIQQHFLYRKMDAEDAADKEAGRTPAPLPTPAAAVAGEAEADGSGASAPVQRPWQSGPARRPATTRPKTKRTKRR